MGIGYLGAFPAQLLHVTTVRPPMHDICSGSRLNNVWVEAIVEMEFGKCGYLEFNKGTVAL